MKLNEESRKVISIVSLTILATFGILICGKAYKDVRDFDSKFQPKDGVSVNHPHDTTTIKESISSE
jgi:hypothetical protein